MALWNSWTLELNAPAAMPFLSYDFINAGSWLGPPPPGIRFGSALPNSLGDYPAAPEFPSFRVKGLVTTRLRISSNSVAASAVIYGKASNASASAKSFNIFPVVMDAHEP